MKKSLLTLALFASTLYSMAQSPDKMSFQAIVRNSSSELVRSTQINIRISILPGTSTAAQIYSEVHNPLTTENGLVSLIIGNGTAKTGSITSINWSQGSFFIKTEIDPTGSTNYTVSSTTELLSVPFALHSKTTERAMAVVLPAKSITNTTTPVGSTVGEMVYNTNATDVVPARPVTWDGTSWTSGSVSLSGDITTNAGAAKVEKIQNVAVSASVPAAGQSLVFDGFKWSPATVTTSGAVADASTTTKGLVQLGGDLGGTAFAPSVKLQGKAISITPATNAQILQYNSTTSAWEPNTISAADASTTTKGLIQLGGDLGGTASVPSVKLQGKAISTTPATNGQILQYNSTTSKWEPNIISSASAIWNKVGSSPAASATTNADDAYLTGAVVIGGNVSTAANADGNAKLTVIGGNASFNGVAVGIGGGNNTTNIAIGDHALFTNKDDANNVGTHNTVVGINASSENRTGSFNSLFGEATNQIGWAGSWNTAMGNYALQNNWGNANVAIGANSLKKKTNGANNVAVGESALRNLQDDANGTNNNIAIGKSAGANQTAGSNNIIIGNGANTPTPDGSNQIRIGDTNITYAGLQVGWTITSDARWKSNTRALPFGLNLLTKLKPVDYTRITDKNEKREMGFIAQDIKQALDEVGYSDQGFLTTDSKGYYEVRYNDLIALAVKGIQELSQQIQTLKDENQKIKTELHAAIAAMNKQNKSDEKNESISVDIKNKTQKD